jgi:hypothetical protein
MIKVLKQAFTDAKRNERHNNVAETRYWLNQYKLIAEQVIAELESQEPVAWVCSAFDGEPCEQSRHDECENPIPLYTHPPQRTEQEPMAWALEWTFDGEEKGRRLYEDERQCKFDAENDGGVCRSLVYV